MNKPRKLAVSLLALEKKKDLIKFLEILNKEKIGYIELPISKISKNYSYDETKLAKFKNILKEYSIKVSSIQSIFYNKNNWNIFDKKKHKFILNHLTKIFRIAKYFSAKNIIFGSPKNRKFNKNDKEKDILAFFNEVAKIANKFDINFCIEPNARYYDCNYINNTDEAIKLVKLVNNKKFLINADTGNIFLEKDRCAAVKKNANLIANFQLSEKKLLSLSKGKINHLKILRNFTIKDQFISLEMLNTNFFELRNNVIKFKKILSKV